MTATDRRTLCPWCRHVTFDETEECCDHCNFHRRCPICLLVVTDAEAETLGNPETCGAAACRQEWWDQANIDDNWGDTL